MLIDSHFHYGDCRVFDRHLTEETLVGVLDEFQIDTTVVQPYPGAPDLAETHDQIAKLAQKHTGRVVGLASFNPHQDEATYFAEIERCVNMGFVAVKLHTLGHAINPASADAEKVFATASELDIPVMIHTGPGSPFAEPAQVAHRAKQFPSLPIILAHAGAGISTVSAIAVGEAFDNIILEPSWCRAGEIASMIDRIGAHRVMFGTDSPINVGVELAKYRALGIGEEDFRMVTEGTARKVYKLVS